MTTKLTPRQEKARDILAAGEIPTTYGPLLVYGIEPEVDMRFEHPVEVRALIDWTRDQGGATVLPHPFRSHYEWYYSELMNGCCDWWLRSVDAIERTWAQNRRDDASVIELAKRLRKGVVVGSDAHYARQVGQAQQEANPITTDAGLVEWLRSFDRARSR